jgi:selenocysteine-specific translation elongation factor
MIVVSKSDLIDQKRKDKISLEISKKIKNVTFDFISSVSNQGRVKLKDDLWKLLNP